MGTPFELSFWQSVADSNDVAQLQAYLAQYPDGTFSGLAKAKIAALVRSAPPPPLQATPAAQPPDDTPAPSAAPLEVPPASRATTSTVSAAPDTGSPELRQAPSLLDQMAAIAKRSEARPPALFKEGGPVPARPEIAQVAALAIPDHFCSAEERNRFYDSIYSPAVAQADRGNEAAIAHLRSVQSLHAQALAAGNVAGANALAREAIDYKPLADQAYAARLRLTDEFARIMAVPISGC